MHGESIARIKRKRTKKAARELEPGEVGGAQDGVSKDAVLSPAEIRKVLDAAPAGYYRTLITTAFISGMRSGELLALRWSD